MPQTLEFYFDFASPYSYLASTQLEALARRTGAVLQWRPFLLGPLFKALGTQPPFMQPARLTWMQKDLEAWAEVYGLPPLVFPESFPINSVLANRLGLVASREEGRIGPFAQAVFRAAFAKARDVSSREVLGEALEAAGLDVERALAQAGSDAIKAELRKNTEDAQRRGAFGAPTFFVGERMFFGNDRLTFVEKALSRAG